MRESELLQHVYAMAGAPTPDVPIPPGDDMAMVQFHGRGLLTAVDQVVDGRHVDLERTPLDLVGRKADGGETRCAAGGGDPAAGLRA
jgi:thiamine monophosphate kinase